MIFFGRHYMAMSLLFVIATLAAIPGALQTFPPDNSLRIWFLETEPLLENYRQFHEHFGNDEVIVVAVDLGKPRSEIGLTDTELQIFRKTITDIESIPGIDQVVSALTLYDVHNDDGVISLQSFFERDAVSGVDFQKLVQSPSFRGRLIDAQGQVMLWLVKLKAMADIDLKRDGIVAAVHDALDKSLGSFAHPTGGISVVYAALNTLTQRDFGIFIGISYLLIYLCLFYVLRSVWLVVAIASALFCASAITLGIYGYLGNKINMVTIAVPSLIFILGLITLIHVPNAVAVAKEDGDSEGAVVKGIKAVLGPCILTSLTTVFGFLAFLSAPMAILRQFGGYTALGVFLVLPIGLAFLAVAFRKEKVRLDLRTPTFVRSMTSWIVKFQVKHSKWLLVPFIVVTVLAIWFARSVSIDTYTLGYLPENSRAVMDHASIQKLWGDYMPLEFIVETTNTQKVTSAVVLSAQREFVRRASEIDEIRTGYSIVDVYESMLTTLRGTGFGKEISQEEVTQLDTLLEAEDLRWRGTEAQLRKNFLRHVTDEERHVGRLTLVAKMMSAKEVKDVLRKLDGIGKEAFGTIGSIKPAGYVPLYVKIVDYIMESQVQSFLIALIPIFLSMLIWLRSLRLAIISLIPNLFPIAMIFGAMGFFGIDLDIATATIAAIVLGVSVDDTIHFLHYWQQAERQGMEWEKALAYTMPRAGSAVIITCVILLVGYPVLMLGSVKTVIYFGALMTFAAFTGVVADLFLLPPLLKFGYPNREQLPSEHAHHSRPA